NAASSTFSINTNYSYNGLLVKYNSSGQFQWSKLLGGNLNEWFTDIATDNTGNIYATGVFYSDSVDFKPTSGSFYLKNKSINGDAFMAKYDATGNLLFAHNFGGASSGIASNPGITIDSNNDIYFCFGYLPNTSTADFDIDPDTSKYILTAGYNIRMVLAKYNSNCKFYWGKEIITFGNNGGSLYNICLDNANSVYLVGNLFDSYCDFDPSPNTNLLSGGNEFYIAKYTSNADLVWALDYDPDAGTCYDIAYHNSGHIYAIGYFHSDTGIDLDPGPGTSILTSGTSTLVAWSAFVVKYTIGGLIGVDELNQDTNNLSLFPNPAKDYLNINSKDNSEFEIYSIDGKLLEVVNTKKTKNVRIDVSNYSEGMYFLLDKSSGTRSKFVIYR
ncbi:MAG TPA: T9SS type A sorting domain-containing protein, partial [Bacteroidia bacterium]|nr:T9SS type A sorting domain-containing protein [Bacteroidia bacterium]